MTAQDRAEEALKVIERADPGWMAPYIATVRAEIARLERRRRRLQRRCADLRARP